MEFVDILRQHGAAPKQDIQAVWRRMVFNILISNTDDHLRNHGFLYDYPTGWRIAPAYDLNPTPLDIKPRILSTAIDIEETRASLELALNVSAYFELSQDEALCIAARVGKVVETWRVEAAKLGLTQKEIDRMSSAFEHEDLKLAVRIAQKKKFG